MALYYDFTVNKSRPGIPDRLAHKANDTAIRAIDAKNSRYALKNQIQREVNQPINQKLLEASQSRKILIYIVFTIFFFINLYIEYDISREIYAVLFPLSPLLFFIFCIGIAFHASICLGETSSHFCLLNLGDRSQSNDNEFLKLATNKLYENKKTSKKQGRWFIHPITGLVFSALVLTVIYLASQQRVAYLIAAGELSDNSFHQYLPVILYVLEIILGVPTFFTFMWVNSTLRYRIMTKRLTEARGIEIDFRRAAIKDYTDYLALLEKYNDWAVKNNELQRASISLCQELQQLLIDELGYDPTNRNGHSSENDSTPIEVSPNDNVPPGSGSNANEMNGTETEYEHPEDSRMQDLLNLVDERIDRENQGLD